MQPSASASSASDVVCKIPFLRKNGSIDLSRVPKYVEFGGAFTCPVDADMCRLILECTDVDAAGKPVINEVCKVRFQRNIVDKLRGGALHTEYSGRRGGLGRRYSSKDPADPAGWPSAGNIGSHAKVIKNTIFQQAGWVDYDMVKGHPTLLIEYSKLIGFTGGLPAVQYYIDNFDSVAAELVEWYSIGDEDPEIAAHNRLCKADIKELFNLTIYGGGHKGWVETIVEGDPRAGNPGRPCNTIPHPRYTAYKNNIQSITNHMYSVNSDLVARVCGTDELDEFHRKNRAMSYFCQILENHCLSVAYKFGLKHNLFAARSIDLCYDGFTTPPPPAGTDLGDAVEKMNQCILDQTGFAIKMKVKPFEKVIHTLIDKRALIAVPASSVSGYVDPYPAWKEEFEKDWCKVGDTYIERVSVDGEFVQFDFHTHKSVEITFMHDTYEDSKGKTMAFIDRWLHDKTQRFYKKKGVFPPPQKCPEGYLNMWVPSPHYNAPIEENHPDYDADAVERFVEHVNIICNKKAEQRQWILSWIAQALQQPAIKPEHMLTFISLQGSGKGALFNVVKKLLGSGKTLETTEPERYCWGGFNECMASAFLVILNETDKRNSHGADGHIKNIISDYTRMINPKGQKHFEVASYHRLVQLTNASDPTPTSSDDRRNYIMRCSDILKGNIQYFTDFKKVFERPHAIRSVFWYLMRFDISEWDFRSVERTTYHNLLVEHSRTRLDLFLEHFVMDNFEQQTVTISGRAMLQKFDTWQDGEGGKKYVTDCRNIMRKFKQEFPTEVADAFRGEKRTSAGISTTIDIGALRRFYKMGCMVRLPDGTVEDAAK